MQKLTKNNMTYLANFAIVTMLILMSFFAFSKDTKYAFKDGKANPIYHGNTDKKCVSIMFNVYWGEEYINGILDVLKNHNVKCTFFVGGSWVEKHGDILKKIYANGHEIGNHGYFHKDHDKLNYDKNMNEIEPNNLLIENIIGSKPKLFAPPSGAYNDETLKVCNDLKMSTIMWSKDTIDWRDKDTALIIKRATNNIKNGDLILAHPTKCTLEALPTILKYYEDNGYSEVIVSENIW